MNLLTERYTYLVPTNKVPNYFCCEVAVCFDIFFLNFYTNVLLQVLLWLKQWDSCVFGSEIRSTSDDVLSALRRHSFGGQNQSHAADLTFTRRKQGHGWSNKNFRHANNSNLVNSNLKGIKYMWSKKTRHTGPPEQKVRVLNIYLPTYL